MKKIKIFICTYKRSDVLNELLENIFTSDFKDYENTEVNIINNHSSFHMDEKYEGKVNVYHNMCRPDWSCGNLGQTWNQALVLGFKNLIQPDAKYVICLQNDCVLDKKWCSNLLTMHQNYDFIAGRFGDNILSYKVNAVKTIGLWDESFQNPHHEADYYIRALHFMKDKCLINDEMHRRVWNPNDDYLTLDIPDGRNINEQLIRKPDDKENEGIWVGCRGGIINDYGWRYFQHKWNGTHKLEVSKEGWIKDWSKEILENPPKPKENSMTMMYPYFEKDIIDLKKKGYWVPHGYGKKQWNEWQQKHNQSNKDSL